MQVNGHVVNVPFIQMKTSDPPTPQHTHTHTHTHTRKSLTGRFTVWGCLLSPQGSLSSDLLSEPFLYPTGPAGRLGKLLLMFLPCSEFIKPKLPASPFGWPLTRWCIILSFYSELTTFHCFSISSSGSLASLVCDTSNVFLSWKRLHCVSVLSPTLPHSKFIPTPSILTECSLVTVDSLTCTFRKLSPHVLFILNLLGVNCWILLWQPCFCWHDDGLVTRPLMRVSCYFSDCQQETWGASLFNLSFSRLVCSLLSSYNEPKREEREV